MRQLDEDLEREYESLEFDDGHVTYVDLQETETGDEDLATLSALPRLVHLNLSGNRDVTDAGVESPGRTRRPHVPRRRLHEHHRCVAHLRGLTRLKFLALDGLDHTRLTHAALPHLVALPHQEELRLNGSGVTDVGVDRLLRVASLEILDVGQVGIS